MHEEPLAAEAEETPLDEQETSTIESELIEMPSSWKRASIMLIKLALPMSVSSGIVTGGAYGTTVILSRLGKDVLSATSLIVSGEMILICVTQVINSTAIVSGRYQAEDRDAVGFVYRNAVLNGVLLSVPMIILLCFVEDISRALDYQEDLAKIAQDFFRIYVVSIPGTMILNANEQIAASLDHPYLMLIGNSIQVSLSLGMGYYFALGKPGLNVSGVAWGAVLGNYASLLASFGYLAFVPAFKPYRLFALDFRKNIKTIQKHLWMLGIPMMLSHAAIFLSHTGITFMGSDFGKDALAAQSVTMQTFSLLGIPSLGFAWALAISCAKLVAMGRIQDVNRYTMANLMMTTAYAVVEFILMASIPNILVKPFIENSYLEIEDYNAVVNTSVELSRITAFSALLVPLQMSFLSTLYAFEDTQTGIFTDIVVELGVVLAIGYLLAFQGGLEMMGFFLARFIGLCLGSAIIMKRYNQVFQNATRGQETPELLTVVKDSVSQCCTGRVETQETDSTNNTANPGYFSLAWRRFSGWCASIFKRDELPEDVSQGLVVLPEDQDPLAGSAPNPGLRSVVMVNALPERGDERVESADEAIEARGAAVLNRT